MLCWLQNLRLLFNSSPQRKKLTAPWKSFHLAIPNWHYHIQFGKGKTKTKPVCQIFNTGNWMSKTLWCLPSCTLRGETSDTRLLDKIFLLAFEISVGRQRILFLTRVRYKYYNHVDALTNSRKHRWAFESHHSCSPYILILQGAAKQTCCI